MLFRSHAISGMHNFHSLNFDLANGIWHVLKDLSRSIHEATDPTINPFEALPSPINPTHLREIEMVSPRILQIENFSQNMLPALRPARKFDDFSPRCRALGWKLWNGLRKLRSDVEYWEGRTVGIGQLTKKWIQIYSQLWKVNYRFRIPRSYPTTLTHSFFTPVFQLNRRVQLLCHRLNIQKKVVWKSNANS